MKRTSVLFVALLLLGASRAAAQSPERGFFNINGGGQTGSDSFSEERRFGLYDEEAIFQGTHEIGGGGLFDVSGGIRVWRRAAVGLGVTRMSDKSDVRLVGSVPHPLFFNRFRDATADGDNLSHEETVVHLQLLWFVPVIPRMDLAVSIGPSFFSVTQQVIGGVDVTEQGPPFSSVGTLVSITDLDESAVGLNLGADLTYLVTSRLGAGLFLRYAGGTADFRTADGRSFSLDVGGTQIGGGLRVRF